MTDSSSDRDTGASGNGTVSTSSAQATLPAPIEVIESVAEALDAHPTDLPPMYDAVDLEAIDRLVRAPDHALPVVVQFDYQRLRVTVSTGGVETRPIDDDSSN
jgi:hypothetical protein